MSAPKPVGAIGQSVFMHGAGQNDPYGQTNERRHHGRQSKPKSGHASKPNGSSPENADEPIGPNGFGLPLIGIFRHFDRYAGQQAERHHEIKPPSFEPKLGHVVFSPKDALISLVKVSECCT